MFDRFAVPPPSRSRRRAAFLGASIAVHAAAAFTLAIAGTWPIERLSLPERQVVFVVQPSWPSPPPDEAPAPMRRSDPPRASRAPGQPTQPARRRASVSTESSDETVVEVLFPGPGGAVGPSDADGEPGGTGTGTGIPGPAMLMPDFEPPPAPPVRREVSARLLEGSRIAGNAHIPPPPAVQARMVRAGERSLRADVRLCLTSTGSVASADVIRSSGYEEYDSTLLREMQGWRYGAYRVGETPVAVCTTVTFLYRVQ